MKNKIVPALRIQFIDGQEVILPAEELLKKCKWASKKIEKEAEKVIQRAEEQVRWMNECLEDESKFNELFEYFTNKPFDRTVDYVNGFKHASEIFLPIIRDLTIELKSYWTVNKTKREKELRGKPKKIFENKQLRDDFKSFYQKNSIRATAKRFDISYDSVKHIAEKLDIKRKYTV